MICWTPSNCYSNRKWVTDVYLGVICGEENTCQPTAPHRRSEWYLCSTVILDDLYQYETHVIWTLDCFVYMIKFMLTCQNFPNFRMCNLTFFLFSLNDYFLFVCTTRLLASNLLMARQDSSCFSSRSCCSTMLKFCSYLMSSLIFKMRPRVCLHFFLSFSSTESDDLFYFKLQRICLFLSCCNYFELLLHFCCITVARMLHRCCIPFQMLLHVDCNVAAMIF